MHDDPVGIRRLIAGIGSELKLGHIDGHHDGVGSRKVGLPVTLVDPHVVDMAIVSNLAARTVKHSKWRYVEWHFDNLVPRTKLIQVLPWVVLFEFVLGHFCNLE